jgi:hypothetical protein
MRQILEEAVLSCWQEAQNLAIIVAPAALLGPIFVIVAGSSLGLALIMLPVVLLAYLAVYAASIRGAARISHNLSPEPAEVYRDVLFSSPDVARVSIPGVLLAAAAAFAVLVVASEGIGFLAVAMGLVGVGAVLFWLGRHAYDLPLVIAHSLPARQAAQGGAQLAEVGQSWTAALMALVASPLVLVALLCWGFSAVVSPVFGGVVFALAVSAWLPVVAFVLTTACDWLVEAASGSTPQPAPTPAQTALDQRPWN